MNIERLRKIIAYSDAHHNEVSALVKQFCKFSNLNYDSGLINIFQICRSSLRRKGFILFGLPFNDDEIGAVCYRGEGLGYVVFNSSLPLVNVNFSLAHEIYHVFFSDNKSLCKAEFFGDEYVESEVECAANLFAGILLMPETVFRTMYCCFYDESKGNYKETLLRLMSYFEVPYTSVLVRCLELNLIDDGINVEELFFNDKDKMKTALTKLWLNDKILESCDIDENQAMENLVKDVGFNFVKEEFTTEYALNKVLDNMSVLHKKIKG